MIVLDALRRDAERFERRLGAFRLRRVDLRLRQAQGRGGHAGMIEFVRQFDERVVAALADIGDDGAHGGGHIFLFFPLGVQQRVEGAGEIGRARVETAGHVRSLRARAGRAPPTRR
ncbi:MAG: hypothetical protein WDM81_14240 [Rhizomicrobium sp.]